MTTHTKALYQHDVLLNEHSTEILTCHSFSKLSDNEKSLFKTGGENDFVITSKETIFHPQGGGQPSDTGTITLLKPELAFDVKLVRKVPNGNILHLGSFNSNNTFSTGDGVLQAIDVAKRRYHSRLHTAGHLIGLAVRASPDIPIESELKANHAPGTAFVEFGGSIPGEFKAAIEERANALVERDLAVAIHWWDAETVQKRCTSVPDVIPTGAGEDIRVVEVIGIGSYPCGGTHLPKTGEVGKIMIRGIKRQKGITKVSYSVEP